MFENVVRVRYLMQAGVDCKLMNTSILARKLTRCSPFLFFFIPFNLFRCVLASLWEGLFVDRSVKKNRHSWPIELLTFSTRDRYAGSVFGRSRHASKHRKAEGGQRKTRAVLTSRHHEASFENQQARMLRHLRRNDSRHHESASGSRARRFMEQRFIGTLGKVSMPKHIVKQMELCWLCIRQFCIQCCFPF